MNYTVKDLAPKLRRTCDWIYNNRDLLAAKGFPAPLPLPGRPMVWPADKVEAFLRGEQTAPPPAAGEDPELVARRERRRQRAKQIAERQQGVANDR